MKPTGANIKIFVKSKLSTDAKWATRALVRIFQENQTEAEKVKEETIEDNGVGFTGADAEFLSSLAIQFINKGFLSDKQMAHVFKKIPKYWSQIVEFIGKDKVKELVEKA